MFLSKMKDKGNRPQVSQDPRNMIHRLYSYKTLRRRDLKIGGSQIHQRL